MGVQQRVRDLKTFGENNEDIEEVDLTETEIESIVMVNPVLIKKLKEIADGDLIRAVQEPCNIISGKNSLRTTYGVKNKNNKGTSGKRSLDDMKDILSGKAESKTIQADNEREN